MKRVSCITAALLVVSSLFCGQPVLAQTGPVVALQTSEGKIVLQLDPAKAPISTANFLQYVKDGYYDGTVFHRVIPGFMIQGGGMTGDLVEKSTKHPAIKNEAANGLLNKRGTVAMARTNAVDSATSQFFINLVDNGFLNHRGPASFGYAVIGQVIEGMDVVDKIAKLETGTSGHFENVPKKQVTIVSAKVVEGKK